ncbi:NRAMP family divalent metal transporter [Neolewinella litorea]|uniref:Divalent metal cation transporter n=1 Tax=Neolewinella litorea TaxID=2562452 RepID=A0A4S4N8J1_9BACT|nr:divalent metal cation transporter [Neolewinella litorea]THH35526.1 divalent metal cation transporter [Neolewinella litorea]
MATATRAGTDGGMAYLPFVLLAAVAGYVFMEMAARVTIVSRQPLGVHLTRTARWLPPLLFAGVAFGCMAYQAGNLLGALGGLQLLFPFSRWWLLPFAAAIVALMWTGSADRIGKVMAAVVALMGILFVVAAALILWGPAGTDRVYAPINATVLLGLLGTTIVPYNFFLAAGLGHDGELPEMRRGLLLSFGIGWLITASIVIVGSTAVAFHSFGDLADGLQLTLGEYGRLVLALGLFAAGFSSATTAPFAAAMAGRGLLSGDAAWQNDGRAFRLTWALVLGVGLLVALLKLDIVGVILLAQIINGLLLPFIALVILLLANRRSLLGDQVNSWWQNLIGAGVLLFLVYQTGAFLLSLL